MYKEIQCFADNTWGTVQFETKEEFKQFAEDLFKIPGKYEFDEMSFMFNEQAKLFRKNGFYCPHPMNTKDYIRYWDTQKDRCRNGVIYKNNGKTWYLTREYYMWLNFLPINDKEQRKLDFPKVRDAQYHMALYELLCELNYKHAAILKKRQIASSYYHCAKMINLLWFEESPILKIGASLKDYINDKGSWRFFNEYKSFLDQHTAWYRPMNPGKVLMWQQQIEQVVNRRKHLLGLKGVLQGVTFDKDPTNGVGGPCTLFFYEEAGIAPTMNVTAEFLFPSMRSGQMTTGLFVAAGSVGDLEQCEPLKKMILYPQSNDIYPVHTDLLDEKGTTGLTGLFIPEQWSMLPYIDEYGNSQVEEALAAILEERKKWKEDLEPNMYQLRISQHPINIAEAFAFREVSKFPIPLLQAQKRRIEDKTYPFETLDIYRNPTGIIEVKPSTKLPIKEFPITKDTVDKESVLVVWERPIANAPWGTYYASVDPVSEGKAEYINNLLYTPTGKKRIGDIKVGDKVIGSDGNVINVTGVYPQGIKKLCKITFNDNTSIKVCEDHLWNVKLNGGTKEYITLSVKDLLDPNKKITYNGIGKNINKKYTISTYYKSKKNKNKWSIPIVKPIEFIQNQDLLINPYLLGLILGDGGISQKSIKFSTIDIELLDSIKNILDDNLLIKKCKNSNCDYSIIKKVGSKNLLSRKLKTLGLKGKRSENKFIPQEYMYSNISDRLLLLQGLMDTDGSYSNNGAEFYSSSKILAYQVVELIQSLGGIAKIRCKKTKKLDSYIVRVLLPKQFNPFLLKRKKDIYRPSKIFSRYIKNIEYIDDDKAICISVDSIDNLYVTENALVTHNTVTSDSLCSIYVYKNPIEVSKINGVETENYIERDKIVAAWCGRFDDINKTHERLQLIIEWYNAWTIVENNISLFIQHMIMKNKQKYLVPKNNIVFLKDIGSNTNVFQEYGWKNTGVLFRTHLLSYLIEFLKEELDTETKPDGTIVKVTYGVERIPDIMAIKEMEGYGDDVNVDRLVALAALIAFAKVQQSNLGYKKRTDIVGKDLQKSKNLYTLGISSPFRHVGRTGSSENRPRRSPFKNIK